MKVLEESRKTFESIVKGEIPVCVFDIETDGLLDEVTKIHSLVHDSEELGLVSLRGDNPNEIWDLEQDHKVLVGHNIINYDIPVIQKLYPDFKPPFLFDTLVASRLMFPDIKETDFRLITKQDFPKRLIGKHSLEAWGYRLNIHKGEFGKTTDWSEWSPEMQKYCEQDVLVTRKLFEFLCSKNYPGLPLAIEHEFAKIIHKQERAGFYFDVEKAKLLQQKLESRRAEIETSLNDLFPAWCVRTPFTPKVNRPDLGYVKGVPTFKEKWIDFNPGSRDHIALCLKRRYGWKPSVFTNTGKPKIDDVVLAKLNYPEAKILAEYFMLDKRLGQLSEGKQAWLKCVKDGRIHGSVITNGAVTGRCTHKHPNIAQVPSVKAPYGAECRELFGPPPGWVQIGCDASGLELRCLAHYMNDPEYTEEILNGDIHTKNQLAAGLKERNQAKTFIYALLYGAGDQKIGSIVCPDGDPTEQQKAGRKLKRKFFKSIPKLRSFVEKVQETAKRRGYLIGIDGRRLSIRAIHSAPNTLLQSAGAIVMKVATIANYYDLEDFGYVFGVDWIQMAHCHDEYQLAVKPELEKGLYLPSEVGVEAITKAGEFLGFRCPLAGESKVGNSWAETH